MQISPNATPTINKVGRIPTRYPVPLIWEAALERVDRELCRVMANIHRGDYDSPFGKGGVNFDCAVFSVHTDSGDDIEEPWNFKWSTVEISWYKRFGRATTANMQLTPDMAAKMLNECIPVIRELE